MIVIKSILFRPIGRLSLLAPSALTLLHLVIIITCSIAAASHPNDNTSAETSPRNDGDSKYIDNDSRSNYYPSIQIVGRREAIYTSAHQSSVHRYLIHEYKEECNGVTDKTHRTARFQEPLRIRCAATLICFRSSCRCPIGQAYGHSNIDSILSRKKAICYDFNEFPCKHDHECQDVDENVICHRGLRRCRCKNGYQFEPQTGLCVKKIKNRQMANTMVYNIFNSKPANQPGSSSSSVISSAAAYQPLPISTIDSPPSLKTNSASSQLLSPSSASLNSEPKFIFSTSYSSKSSSKSMNVSSNQKIYFHNNADCNSNSDCNGEFTYCHRKKCKCWPEFGFIEYVPRDRESSQSLNSHNNSYADLMLADSPSTNGTGEETDLTRKLWKQEEMSISRYGMCRRKLCSSDFDCRTDDNPNLVCNTTICECRHGFVMYRETKVCVRFTIRRQSCDITCKVIGGLFASIFMLTLIYWCFYCCYSIVKNYRLQQLFANNRRNNSTLYGIDDGMLGYDPSSYFHHHPHHRGSQDPRIRTGGTVLGTAGSRFSINFNNFLRPLPINDDPPSYSQATGDEYLPNYDMVMEMQALHKEENNNHDSHRNNHNDHC